MSWPYDEMDNGDVAEDRDIADEREEREQARRDRLDDHAPASGPVSHFGNACPVFGLVCDGAIGGDGRCCRDARVVVEVVPPGEGDPQTELYRALTGARVVKSMRVEWS